MNAISETAARRLRALDFWERHGLAATMDAFGVSRRTLYGWKKAWREAAGHRAALNNRSRAPVRRRKRAVWDSGVLEHLVALRVQHPALGFEKLHIFLAD